MTFLKQRKSKAVHAGSLTIGGGASVSVQSMLNVPAEDIQGDLCYPLSQGQ